jgi:tetratricopeptide (TPR) repeat protein
VPATVEYPLVNPDEMAGAAWAAMSRGAADEALRLWQQLRRDFPERPEGYVWPVQMLWQSGRLDEAEITAAEAFARFPENADVLIQYGWIAMVRERWEEALRWWTAVRTRAPERIDGYLWGIRALWRLSRFEDAEAMAADALTRFPRNAEIEVERAWTAVHRGDWQEALVRWQRVLTAQPERREARIGLIQAMRWVGHAAAAEQIAVEALGREPDDSDLLVEYVWTAAGRGDWDAAAARLDAARGRLLETGRYEPTRTGIEALRRTALGLAAAPLHAVPEVDEVPPPNELMLSFESLGERCDFGAVQRHYGVEPLGLLRFAYSPYEPLVAALEERFEAVGTVEDTGFELFRGETILIMKKYGLIFHTFVDEAESNTPQKRDAFREQQRRRLLFLKRKLLADLEEPQKIYVYSSDERTSEEDAARLHKALRAIGPSSLLYVRPADAAHPEGVVQRLDDGLYMGRYSGLADFMAGEQPPFELWRQMCEETYRLERRRASGR